MAQQVKVFTVKSDHVGSISETQVVEGENFFLHIVICPS